MQKILFLFSFFIILATAAFATHNRAGEITFAHLTGLQYQVQIVTYTKVSPPSDLADRPGLRIFWGDGTSDSLSRSNGPNNQGELIANDIKKNIYIGVHTYPGTSTYLVHFEDPNRNGGVINILGSVDIPFYVESQLIISGALGYNNSVVLLQPPIDQGVVGIPFIHNANAYDPDGDSLSYELIECKGADGITIPSFSYPIASNSFSIDPITGDLVWDSPTAQGEYNVAFLVKEWRNGFLIGYVERDMQINIQPFGLLHPPVITNIDDICVEAGTLISFPVTATDPDNEHVTLTATGGPFILSPDPAVFPEVTGTGSVTGTFTWQTTCAHVRKSSYQVTFRAADDNNLVSLSDLESIRITVVAPAPKNPAVTPLGSSIIFNWDQEVCSNAQGYDVYRRNGSFPFTPGPCETGLPAFTGYTKIATLQGVTTTSYTDDNNGAGLDPAKDYCYRVVAFFADGAESYTSDEVCTHLKKDIPVITNVSVTATDATNGTMYVAWSKPAELDTVQFPGPYEYRLFRSAGFAGANLTQIAVLTDLNDTTFNDAGLNTVSGPYSYVVELNNAANGFIGKTQVGSSVFLSIAPSDHSIGLSWNLNVPWANDLYIIYRQNGSVYDSIGFSITTSYIDAGLMNGVQYCYYVQSVGGYPISGFVDPIINLSQQVCATPFDNVPPCITALDTANFDCASGQINFNWTVPDNSCASDLDHYNIYYSPTDSAAFQLLISINNTGTTTYSFESDLSVAGCFYITAVDSNGNESAHQNEICVDNCPFYTLPNVFTPGTIDTKNDVFKPFPYRFVKDIDLVIFNRWGQKVFTTTDPDIQWNGRVNGTGKDLPEGVYFYICTVNEIFRSGIRQRVLKPGFVHLLRGGNKGSSE